MEVLDAAGSITQIRLTAEEVEALADHLYKLIAPPKAGRRTTDEVTQVNSRDRDK